MEAARDHRGGSKGSFTWEMLKDIDDAVRNRNPKDHGYSKNRWKEVLIIYAYNTPSKARRRVDARAYLKAA